MIIFLSHLHFLHDLDDQEIRKSIKLLQDIYTNAVEFNDILNEFWRLKAHIDESSIGEKHNLVGLRTLEKDLTNIETETWK